MPNEPSFGSGVDRQPENSIVASNPVAWPEPEARHRPWSSIENVLVCEVDRVSEDRRKDGSGGFCAQRRTWTSRCASTPVQRGHFDPSRPFWLLELETRCNGDGRRQSPPHDERLKLHVQSRERTTRPDWMSLVAVNVLVEVRLCIEIGRPHTQQRPLRLTFHLKGRQIKSVCKAAQRGRESRKSHCTQQLSAHHSTH